MNLHSGQQKLLDCKPLFIFERSTQAAMHNAAILKRFNFDLKAAILAQSPSQVSFGSEFRDSCQLQELLQDHPFWKKLKDILDNGATFPLNPIDDASRKSDLEFHADQGNHKSTIKFKEPLDLAISEDVLRGFSLPLPVEILFDIPNASLAPLGCIHQDTIDEHGKKSHKYWMTHDQTFPGPSGTSVNLRVIKEDLPPILYSFALCRTIHYIVNVRLHYPNTKIFL
jgi:hypothetical protein